MLYITDTVDLQLDEKKKIDWISRSGRLKAKFHLFFIQNHRKKLFQSPNIPYQSWRVSRLFWEKQKIPMKNNSTEPISYHEVKHTTFSPKSQKKGWKNRRTTIEKAPLITILLPRTISNTAILTSSTCIYTHCGTNIRPGVYVGWIPANIWNRIRYAPSALCIWVSYKKEEIWYTM